MHSISFFISFFLFQIHVVGFRVHVAIVGFWILGMRVPRGLRQVMWHPIMIRDLKRCIPSSAEASNLLSTEMLAYGPYTTTLRTARNIGCPSRRWGYRKIAPDRVQSGVGYFSPRRTLPCVEP